MISEELSNLKCFFKDNPVVALCFSGGVSSSYLLYAGLRYGTKIKAYYVKSEFQPQFELNDALHFAEQYHADLSVLNADILSNLEVVKNSSNRCYYCKTAMMEIVKKQAAEDGYPVLIDGTNASSVAGERPAMQALTELGVRSPLRECSITKYKVRLISKKEGLVTWNKRAYACLAARVPNRTKITAEALGCIERAESELFTIGLIDFKVKIKGRTAKLQIPSSQMETAVEKREIIMERLKPDFDSILLDLAGY